MAATFPQFSFQGNTYAAGALVTYRNLTLRYRIHHFEKEKEKKKTVRSVPASRDSQVARVAALLTLLPMFFSVLVGDILDVRTHSELHSTAGMFPFTICFKIILSIIPG